MRASSCTSFSAAATSPLCAAPRARAKGVNAALYGKRLVLGCNCIAPLQALLGHRRIVVAVNEVVRHAGMVRVLRTLGLEDPRSFQGRRVGLVGRLLRGGEVYRIENLCLVVLREALRHDLESTGE